MDIKGRVTESVNEEVDDGEEAEHQTEDGEQRLPAVVVGAKRLTTEKCQHGVAACAQHRIGPLGDAGRREEPDQ
jgi:hypothetical protein